MQATKALVRVIIADLRATDGETQRWNITDGNTDTYINSKSAIPVIEWFLSRIKTDKNTIILVERES